MNSELNIYGVFVPALFAWALIALALGSVLRHALAWIGFYRLVWHRPLFDLAFYVVLLGAVVSLAIGSW
jgi:hypothetical protein